MTWGGLPLPHAGPGLQNEMLTETSEVLGAVLSPFQGLMRVGLAAAPSRQGLPTLIFQEKIKPREVT